MESRSKNEYSLVDGLLCLVFLLGIGRDETQGPGGEGRDNENRGQLAWVLEKRRRGAARIETNRRSNQ